MRISLLLASLLLAQETASVTVQMRDGSIVSGTTETLEVPFESSLGKIKVSFKDLVAIQFDGADAVVGTADGTNLKGKVTLESLKVKTRLGEVTLKGSDIVLITIRGVAAPPPVPPPAPAAPPPGAAKPEPPKGAGLSPAKTVKLGVAVSRALRTADGKKLILLNASDSKVHVFNAETLDPEREIALAGGETFMSLAPSGNVLMAAGKRTITSVSLAQGKVLKTFSIEMDVQEVCAVDDSSLVASAGGTLAMISVPKQAIVAKTYGGTGARMHLSRDGKRIHTGSGSLLLPDKTQGREEMGMAPSRGGSGDLAFSPDGRFGVSAMGAVYRLGKSFVADLVEIGKVEPHWSCAWAPARKRLYLVTSLGFVKEYDTESWELARSWVLGYQLSYAFADEAGTSLVGIGVAANPAGGSETPRYSNQPLQAGHLYKFEIPQ